MFAIRKLRSAAELLQHELLQHELLPVRGGHQAAVLLADVAPTLRNAEAHQHLGTVLPRP